MDVPVPDRRVREAELLERLGSFGGTCQGQYSAKMRFPRAKDFTNVTTDQEEPTRGDAKESRNVFSGKQMSVSASCIVR